MEKPNLIIFTVGTSLLLRNKREYNGVRGGVKRNLPTKTEKSIKEEINSVDSAFNKFLKELLKVDPKTEINKRGPSYDPENNPDNLPAELSSFYLFYFPSGNIPDTIPSKEPKDKVALIYSPDKECIFCAYCIMKYLTTKFSGMIDDFQMIKMDGLDPKDKEKFEREGMRELLSKISTIINDYEDSHNIILNVTGGYKGAVPYLTLLGMCQERIEVIYLFEESKANITLPKMPIAFDIFTWRNYRGFIEAVPHLKREVAEMILDKILPPQISGLFEKEEVGDKYLPITLGEILREKYDEQKEGELTPYGRGYLLVDKIQDDQKQEALRDCINRWQYLWIGDIIPETVEHARGHTQRDLELAAQILYPILNEEGDFFGNKDQTDNNLLALISSVWLHDLGHSGDYIKWENDDKGKPVEHKINGFPSLIRDIHHMLSWYLIGKEKDDLFKSRDGRGEWTRDTTIFTEDLIEAIRKICLYHRGKMPVLDGEKYEYIGIEVKKPLKVFQKDLVNIPLLGALLRVVDEGDVQAERTISPNYKAMRFLQNRREIEKLEKEEKQYSGMLNDLFDGSSCHQLPEYLSYLKEIAKKYFDGENLELLDLLVDKCVQKFIQGEGLESIDAENILRKWFSALNQYIFKKRQPFHFKKHEGISAVMYLLDRIEKNNKNKNEYHFKIRVIHREVENEGEREKIIENAKQEVLKAIFDEYKKVENILNTNRIFFDSYERMEEGSKEIETVNFVN